MSDNTFPTEVIELPSAGHFYPPDHPLASGKIELRYMTAKEEDILMSQNLIKKGVAIEMVLKSLIVTKFPYESMLLGDKNAVMIAVRVLAYGDDYVVDVTCPECEKVTKEFHISLNSLNYKKIDYSKLEKGINEFLYVFPNSKRKITWKILTNRDEDEIEAEMKGLEKIVDLPGGTGIKAEMTTRLKRVITSVDSIRDLTTIYKFVDKELLSRDALAFRKHIATIVPDVDMTTPCTCKFCDEISSIRVPITVEFFWPTGR